MNHKMKCISFLILILAFSFSSLFISGCSKTKTVTTGDGYTYETVEGDPLKARIYTLDNGLKVYMTVYKDAPRIQTCIPVKVGHKNDPADNTGMAHYLEHLMFKGSDEFGTIDWEKEKVELDKISDLFEVYRAETDSAKRIAIYHQIDSVSGAASQLALANEYDRMLASIGATGTNAFTSVEQTVYINDVPNNQLDKWLKIEKERFQDLVTRLFHTELEIVYEEKNMSLDNDRRKASEALLAGLFQKHPYGTQTTLGRVEHLKNPSLKTVNGYHDTYYVPNNMAICLSGDFDPDEVIKKIDDTFGQLQSKDVPVYTPPVEEPIAEPIVKEVLGPDAESVSMAFRFPGIGSKEADLLTMTDMILSNSQAGLIDLNLNQKQKVIGAYSYPRIMKDYSYHGLGGRPRQGQELEEITQLLLSQIDLVKKGDFPDWLLQAIINDLKLNRLRGYERNWSRAYAMANAFILDLSWEDHTDELNRLSKITKQDIIDFANKYYTDNYVVVYKRTGKDKDVKKISKPKLTPVNVNRADQSTFFKDVQAMEVEDIQPVFVDFEKDIKQFSIKNNIPVFYKENSENDLFQLYYLTDMGTDNNKKLGIALRYLRYLGTSEYSPEEIKQEFYKIGCSFNVNSSSDQVWVRLNGLKENFQAGVKLFERLLADAQPNPEALNNLVKDILKTRADNKLSKRAILWGAMYNYGTYGPKSSYTHLLNEDELNALQPQELIKIINEINSFEHRVLYYGPDDQSALTSLLDEFHNVPEKLTVIPEAAEFPELPTKQTKVYLVNYDMKQAEIIMLSKSELFNKDNTPIRSLFNEYYGGNMSSVVFQEMRESKALAYSVYGAYRTPAKKEKAHYVFSYIGTQVDKLPEAMQGFFELLTNMLESETSLNLSKESIVKSIAPQRITKSDILFRYERAKKLGIDYDSRKPVFEQVPNLTMNDLKSFFTKYIENKEYTILVLGDVKKINKRALAKYGKVKQLTLEEIFGY